MDTRSTAEEHFRRGVAALEAGAKEEALEQLRTAHRLDPTHARYRSYYGMALGLVERRFDKALELCRSAAKEEFFNPVLYHNLARVHLAFGFKAEAIRYLRRGLMIDPGNREITAQLRGLGVRRRPVFGFLGREHLLNRWLGSLVRRARSEPTLLEAFQL
jgi:tetratricopeptide (TPR) repeat protein